MVKERGNVTDRCRETCEVSENPRLFPGRICIFSLPLSARCPSCSSVSLAGIGRFRRPGVPSVAADISMQSLEPLLSHHPKSPFLPCWGGADCCPLRPRLSTLSWGAAPLGGGFISGGGNPLRSLVSIRRGVAPWLQNSRWDGLGSVGDGEKGNGGRFKNTDVVTLGNLCVDIVLNVPSLPPPSREGRQEYFNRLSASPPDKVRRQGSSSAGFSAFI